MANEASPTGSKNSSHPLAGFEEWNGRAVTVETAGKGMAFGSCTVAFAKQVSLWNELRSKADMTDMYQYSGSDVEDGRKPGRKCD